MGSLRRGFKAEANRRALAFRHELGVPADGPLCPWRLAEFLGIRVLDLSEFAQDDSRVAYLFSDIGLWEFSGATLSSGDRRLIIIHDGHPKKRQASDLSHELSHCILGHCASGSAFNDLGLRKYDEEHEEEANWLGPALLISEEAALSIVRQGLSIQAASDAFLVTEQIVQMRLNLTGAIKRASRSLQTV